MAVEWWKSKSNHRTIENLVFLGVIHNQKLSGWREPGSESTRIPNQVRS